MTASELASMFSVIRDVYAAGRLSRRQASTLLLSICTVYLSWVMDISLEKTADLTTKFFSEEQVRGL